MDIKEIDLTDNLPEELLNYYEPTDADRQIIRERINDRKLYRKSPTIRLF